MITKIKDPKKEVVMRRADLRRAILCNCKLEKTKISYRGKTVLVNFTEVDK